VVLEVRQLQYGGDELWFIERFKLPDMSTHLQAAHFAAAPPPVQKEILQSTPILERMCNVSCSSYSSPQDTIFEILIAGTYKMVSGMTGGQFRLEEAYEGRTLTLPVVNDSLKLRRIKPQLVYVEYYRYPVIIDCIYRGDTLCQIPYTMDGGQQGRMFKPGRGVFTHQDIVLILSRSEFNGWRLFELRGRSWGPIFDEVDGDFIFEGKKWLNVVLQGRRFAFNVPDSVLAPVPFSIRKVIAAEAGVYAIGGPMDKPSWAIASGKSMEKLQVVSGAVYQHRPDDSRPSFWYSGQLITLESNEDWPAGFNTPLTQYVRDVSTIHYLQVSRRGDSTAFQVKNFPRLITTGIRPSIAVQNRRLSYSLESNGEPAIYGLEYVSGERVKLYPVPKVVINPFDLPKEQ
jgi:hypothetical protein